jgi:hypothetical protein
MKLRWVAGDYPRGLKGFRRLNGYADMPTLVSSLRSRDRQMGLVTTEEDSQIA